ncbi:MAG: glycosyltransferase family 4 protein [Desulfuromonadales bacterium]|nr:glycosyltransferase family 4 protein [Desulfuromonadales bacterium]
MFKATIGAVSAKGQGRDRLYLGSSGDGILSNSGIPTTRYWYHRSRWRLVTLFTYLFSQLVLFCKLLADRTISSDAVIFVNTLLPFGAALYGRLTDRKVIYHVHEISITPAPLKMLLVGIARRTSQLNLYVSDAHMQAMPIAGVPARRVYNALDDGFLQVASSTPYVHSHDGCFNVLMIASLRDYKGILELLALADAVADHEDIRFHLVVNDDEAAIARYFAGKDLPANLAVYPRTSDPAAFYLQASLVLNLSRVDQWVETFGLTILEAMAFGIPVIVPPVGGPAELVVDGVHGFQVNAYDQALLTEKLLLLYQDRLLCERMSQACRQRAAEFSPEAFAENILAAIEQMRGAHR